MSRIKKRGLDYFPISIDFMHDRVVRRIMKSEGDAAVSVLLQVLCSIYAGEGYYVRADDLFYDDQADNLYQMEPEDIRRIVALALELGLFDSEVFSKYGLLTSAEIQRQFLFATKRRNASLIDARYCLLSQEELGVSQPAKSTSPAPAPPVEKKLFEDEKAAIIPITATFNAEKAGNVYFGTHSIAQNSIAQQSIENPLLNSSPGGGTVGNAALKSAEEGEEEIFPEEGVTDNPVKSSGRGGKRKEWTLEEIARLQPPLDGMQRNFDGLLCNLRLYPIPPAEQYAIICKSNFGVIGHPVWRGFYELRGCHGKIRQPGHYLLSLCRDRGKADVL